MRPGAGQELLPGHQARPQAGSSPGVCGCAQGGLCSLSDKPEVKLFLCPKVFFLVLKSERESEPFNISLDIWLMRQYSVEMSSEKKNFVT